MPLEHERKFLLKDISWKSKLNGMPCYQGYIVQNENVTVRVRIMDGCGYMTLKSRTPGTTRLEYEYQIPQEDALEILKKFAATNLIEKTRYHVSYHGHIWEIDEFHGKNSGLYLAEIELSDPKENFATPPWLGTEVTHDQRYYNSYLAEHPFSTWGTLS